MLSSSNHPPVNRIFFSLHVLQLMFNVLENTPPYVQLMYMYVLTVSDYVCTLCTYLHGYVLITLEYLSRSGSPIPKKAEHINNCMYLPT